MNIKDMNDDDKQLVNFFCQSMSESMSQMNHAIRMMSQLLSGDGAEAVDRERAVEFVSMYSNPAADAAKKRGLPQAESSEVFMSSSDDFPMPSFVPPKSAVPSAPKKNEDQDTDPADVVFVRLSNDPDHEYKLMKRLTSTSCMAEMWDKSDGYSSLKMMVIHDVEVSSESQKAFSSFQSGS